MGKKDKKELPKGIYKRGGVFWIRYAGIDGKIIFESAKQGDRLGTKVGDAEALLHERKADVGRGKQPEIRKKIPNITFKELSVEYLQWAKRQRSFRQKETLVKQLVTIFGAYPLRAFNSRLLEQYQTERMEKSNKQVKYQVGNKPGTINRHVATIKAMFTKAVEWELVEEDALKKVRKVKLLEENNRRLRYLSVEECGKLLNECPKHLRPIVITALHTGMRRGEILGLKWENIDLKHGFILLDKTKNGERREIPIDQTLRATLTGYCAPSRPALCLLQSGYGPTLWRHQDRIQPGLQEGRDKGLSLSRSAAYVRESPCHGRAGHHDRQGAFGAQEPYHDPSVCAPCARPRGQSR